MWFLLLLVVVFAVYAVIEYRLHIRNLQQIPIRIQVNGTRGKSSVTRLIAAGLRAGGMKVVAKTTGTLPRFITGDQEEEPIRRLGRANIIENVKIIRRMARMKPEAVVLECMALVPQNQWLDAHRLIQPTHGVITNVRADHLDVMGPTVQDVAQALSNTIPDRAVFFTAERNFLPVFARRAARAGTKVVHASAETVSDNEMKGFRYVEHRENVALALSVCEALKVERRTALAGMYRSLPDPGAMRIYMIVDQGKNLELVNTLAANDPDSIALLWQMMATRKKPERIVLVNCRADRVDRSRQLAELCAKRLIADFYVASGGMTNVFVRSAVAAGIEPSRITDVGDRPVDEVYQAVLKLVERDALVFATGNTVGYGSELIGYFAQRGAEIDY